MLASAVIVAGDVRGTTFSYRSDRVDGFDLLPDGRRVCRFLLFAHRVYAAAAVASRRSRWLARKADVGCCVRRWLACLVCFPTDKESFLRPTIYSKNSSIRKNSSIFIVKIFIVKIAAFVKNENHCEKHPKSLKCLRHDIYQA